MVYHCNSTNPSVYDKAYFEAFLFRKLGSVQYTQSVADSDVTSQRSSDQEQGYCSSTDLEPASPSELEHLFSKTLNSLCFSPALPLSDPDPRFRNPSPRLIGVEIIPGNPTARRYYNERNERVFEGIGLRAPRAAFEIARDKISAKDWKRKVEDREGDWDGDDWGKKKEVRELLERVVAKAKSLAMKTRQARSMYGQGTK